MTPITCAFKWMDFQCFEVAMLNEEWCKEHIYLKNEIGRIPSTKVPDMVQRYRESEKIQEQIWSSKLAKNSPDMEKAYKAGPDPCFCNKGTRLYPGEAHIHFPDIKATEPSQGQKIHSTNFATKKAHFNQFAELLKNQFEDGSGKYAVEGFEDMEATDLICKLWEKPGFDEVTWILKTMIKYVFRFERKHREKDLLKIATYCYILWLKMGFHKSQTHDTDTKGEGHV